MITKKRSMKKLFNLSIYALLAFFAFVSCNNDDDNPQIENEEEVITTLIYTLTPTDGGDTVKLQFEDLDGDGADAPIFTPAQGTAKLAKNKTYNGSIQLLNKTEDPEENVTEEIEEEDDEHQFFFSSSSNNVTFEYADEDENGNPVGLKNVLKTADEATENVELTVTLVHEPIKDADGVATGNQKNAGGSIDISVKFKVNVE